MYKVTVEFATAAELAEFVAGITGQPVKEAKVKPVKEDKTAKEVVKEEPKTVDIDAIRKRLREKVTASNAKGDSYRDANRAALNSFGGAKSITVLDPKDFENFEKEIDEIAAS